MFLNIVSSTSSSERAERSKLRSIYNTFNNLLGLTSDQAIKESMQSPSDNSSVVGDAFITPVSSCGDLMAMSPKRRDLSDFCDQETVNDLLTGAELDSICDITMHEMPTQNDMIIDASSIDFLVKCADSNRNLTLIDRGKESLFVKFDPLYSRQKLESLAMRKASLTSSSNECDIGYETGSVASVNTDNFIVSPKRSVSSDSMAYNCSKDKPTQRVLPAIKHDIPETNISATVTRSTPALVRSLSAIMTPNRVATDRLISINGNTPPIRQSQEHISSHQLDHLQSLKMILQKQDLEILQLRQENREIKSCLLDTQHKLTRTQEDMDTKLKKITEEKDSLIEKENRLLQQINEKNISNKQMCIVMEEYEKTISSLIEEQQSDKRQSKEIQDQLTAERDVALQHLNSMESSFSDLLLKYEKCKSVILEVKENEKQHLKKIEEYESALKKYDSIYAELKEVTSTSLAKANETLENIQKSHSHEIAKLNATIQKKELAISSLQESLTQKIRQNEELSKICDQLINSVH